MPFPPFRLTRQLRCSEQISRFGNKDPIGIIGNTYVILFNQLSLAIYHFLPDSTFKPWQILCEEEHYLDAVVWALSDEGGRLWYETKGDVYIVDPSGKMESKELKRRLLEEKWTAETIPASQIKEGPCEGPGEPGNDKQIVWT